MSDDKIRRHFTSSRGVELNDESVISTSSQLDEREIVDKNEVAGSKSNVLQTTAGQLAMSETIQVLPLDLSDNGAKDSDLGMSNEGDVNGSMQTDTTASMNVRESHHVTDQGRNIRDDCHNDEASNSGQTQKLGLLQNLASQLEQQQQQQQRNDCPTRQRLSGSRGGRPGRAGYQPEEDQQILNFLLDPIAHRYRLSKCRCDAWWKAQFQCPAKRALLPQNRSYLSVRTRARTIAGKPPQTLRWLGLSENQIAMLRLAFSYV